MHKIQSKKILFIAVFLFSFQLVNAQDHKLSLRDTVDGQFDLSNYIINLHGFVPYPAIITQPALGGFGGALGLLFIQPKKGETGKLKYHYPDITGVGGMYTLNNSWAVGAGRQGSFPKIGMRYKIGGGFGSINMNFYRQFENGKSKEFLFNIKPVGGLVDISENVWKKKLYVGVSYGFANIQVSNDYSGAIDTIFDLNGYNKNIGNLGAYFDFDTRNTIFTPDKGVRFKSSYSMARPWTLSDYNFELASSFITPFIPIKKKWVLGFRVFWQAAFGDAPFYAYPFIQMRGISAMQFQGQQVIQFETEERFDITYRWSIVGFVGTGRTFSDKKFMQNDKWETAGGAGFRYLIASVFHLRMGVDLAGGPGTFAYYIVLGQYWNN